MSEHNQAAGQTATIVFSPEDCRRMNARMKAADELERLAELAAEQLDDAGADSDKRLASRIRACLAILNT